MPQTLFLYIVRLFFGFALLSITSLSALVLIFDVMANADRVLTGGSRVVVPLLAYAGLRLPDIVLLTVPLAALLAAMLTYGRLVANGEMQVIRASGLSLYGVVGAAVMGAVIIAGLHFAFAEFVRPATASRLHVWERAGFAGLPPFTLPEQAPAWFATNEALVNVETSSRDGTVIYGVYIVRRDSGGQMIDVIEAERGRYEEGRWVLENGMRIGAGNGSREAFQRLGVELAVSPEKFSMLSTDPSRLGIGDLFRLSHARSGSSSAYAFWIQRKFAQPASVLVLVLLAAPLGRHFSRVGSFLLTALPIIGGGFVFFVTEQLLVALGEAGTLPPALAAWAPAVLFTIIGLWVLILIEN